MKNVLIILGSSRSHGDTRQLVDYILEKTNWEFIDLRVLDVATYDYEYKSEADDFQKVVVPKLLAADLIIYASPVYWYTMSAVMKKLFDRFSDLVRIHKPQGRQLRGKSTATISCSSDDELVKGFYMPYRESANYLGMNYIGELHGWLEDGKIPIAVQQRLDDFIALCTKTSDGK